MEILGQSVILLLRHPLRAFLSMLGVAVAVAGIIAVTATERSWQSAIGAEYEQLYGVNVVHLSSPSMSARAKRRSLVPDDARAILTHCSSVVSVEMILGPVPMDVRSGRYHARLNCYQVSPMYLEAMRWATELAVGRTVSKKGCWLSPIAQRVLLGDHYEGTLPPILSVAGRVVPLNGIAHVGQTIDYNAEGFLFVPIDDTQRQSAGESLQLVATSRDPRTAASQIDELMNTRLGMRRPTPLAYGAWRGVAELSNRRAKLRLFTVVALGGILLVSILGVASTLMANIQGQIRDIALRRALGAQRRQVACEVLAESTWICLVGGVFGTAGGIAIMHLAGDHLLLGSGLSHWASSLALYTPAGFVPKADWMTIALGVSLCLCSALAAAWVPASMAANQAPAVGLTAAPSRRHQTERVLALMQIAVGACTALLLLALYAGLANASLAYMRHKVGADLIELWGFGPGSRQEYVRFCNSPVLLQELADAGKGIYTLHRAFAVKAQVKRKRSTTNAIVTGVSEGLGNETRPDALELRSGRAITRGDRRNNARVCIIGSEVAESLFGTDSPVGQSIRIDGYPFLVIGALEPFSWKSEILDMSSGHDSVTYDDYVIVPDTSAPAKWLPATRLKFRVAPQTDPGKALANIGSAIRRLAGLKPGEEIVLISRLDLYQHARRAATDRALKALLVGSIGFWTALIGLVNLLFISYHSRTREVGLLRAIGATRARIVSGTLLEALALAAAGCSLGLVAAFGLSKLLGKMADLPVLIPPAWAAIVIGSMLVVTCLAALLPAHAAASVDPAVALRQEDA